MTTNLPKSASPSETRDWNAIIAEANRLRELLNEKPASLRLGVWAKNPGSILNAYREGDLNFAEAVEHLTAAEPRRDEREEFEKWLTSFGKYAPETINVLWTGSGYSLPEIQSMWESWQASRASAALPQMPHVCKPPEERGYKYGNDWTCSCSKEFVLLFDKEDAARWVEWSAVPQPSAGQTEGK